MSAQEFLVVDRLSRDFGGQRAVAEVSFTLPEGALTALIGPNGAGKTTLFNLVAGALPPTSGAVRFRRQPVLEAAQATRLGVARTFQNIRLFPGLSVLENVLAAMGGHSFWQGSFRLPRRLEEERLRLKRAHYLLEDLGLAHLGGQPARTLPFGQQRLLELARALALQPRLLLLDEPAAGLNRTETAALADLIRRLHGRGLSLLLVEHDMHLVMHLASRVIVLEQGRIIADGTPAGVQNDERVRTAYLGPPAE
jgi:branched-chain amino acid transport system ATP-binding protein